MGSAAAGLGTLVSTVNMVERGFAVLWSLDGRLLRLLFLCALNSLYTWVCEWLCFLVVLWCTKQGRMFAVSLGLEFEVGLGLFGNGSVIIGVHAYLVTQTINLLIFNVLFLRSLWS